MIGAIAQAMRSPNPHLLAGTVAAVNAITAARAGNQATADWTYEHDTKTGASYRFNKRTGQREQIDAPRGGGSADAYTDKVLQPGDPERLKYTSESDPRPWRLTTDDKGNIKPEPLPMNPIQEEATKIADKLESTESYKKFKEGYGSVQAMDAALAEGNNVGDFNATIQAFKVIDPGSTVTSNEQTGISIIGGAEGIMKDWKSKLSANGGRLTEDMRADLYNAANEQMKAKWHANAKNDVNVARRRGELLGRGDKTITGIATNFLEDPKFERKSKEWFPDGGRKLVDGKPQGRDTGEVGRDRSKPLVVKKTFKDRAAAMDYLDAVGSVKPGYYEVEVEGEGRSTVFAGQRD
jgi:hypothetical protein